MYTILVGEKNNNMQIVDCALKYINQGNITIFKQ